MSRAVVPTYDEIMSLYGRYEMLSNIREHSLLVGEVALAVCGALVPGCTVDKELTYAAALLHDITKTESFRTKEPHAESAEKLLIELGYPEIADIVGQHVTLRNFEPEGDLNEAEIVYYADKRVCHSEIVTVKGRIEDLLVRYGHFEESRARIRGMGEIAKQIGIKIERNINGSLEELVFGV